MNLWYFGFHYIESVFVLTIKASHPEGKESMSGTRARSYLEFWTWLRKQVDVFRVPRALAPTWFIHLDLNEDLDE